MFNVPIGDIILWFVVFLFSLSFHESAHAWTSERYGDDTGRHQGRITLNPLPHIDPIGTILLPLMGFASGGLAMFGWAKPVETNPLLWRDKTKANIMVSAAGPISNFILAIVAFVAIKGMMIGGLLRQAGRNDGGPFTLVVPTLDQGGFMEPLATMLSIMLLLNVTLGVFNLLPIPPLDGSHVMESILPYEMSQAYAQLRPWGFLLLLGLMLTPVFGWIFRPIGLFINMLLFGQ